MSTIRMTHFQRHKHPEGPQIINDLLIKNDHSNFFPIRNLPYDSFTPHHHNFKKLFKANRKILKLPGKLDSKTEGSHKNQGKVLRTPLPSQKYSFCLKFLLLENLPIKLTKVVLSFCLHNRC